MAAPKGFDGLMAIRTLLGAAESTVTPGFALLTARFYTRQEQPLRFALWYSCNGIGSCIGGLLGMSVGGEGLLRSHFGLNAALPHQAMGSDISAIPGSIIGLGFSSSMERLLS